MKIALVAALAWALALGGAALGNTRAATDPYKNCLDRATTTVAMLACNDAEYRRVDAELNRVYKQLVAKLSPARRKLLAKAQLRWIAFRDAECAFSASVVAGGTLEPVLYGACLIDLTQKRTKDLRAYLRQPD